MSNDKKEMCPIAENKYMCPIIKKEDINQMNQTTQSNLPSEESLRIEYQGILDALKSAKNQQWLVSTYVIALQAGILKFFIDTKDLLITKGILNNFIYPLIIGTWGICFAGISLLAIYYYDIFNYRREKIRLQLKLRLDEGRNERCFKLFELLIILSFGLLYLVITHIISKFLFTQLIY